MAQGVTVTGDKQLDRQLGLLIPKEAKKLLRKATRSVAKVVKADVVANIGKQSGQLKRAIKVKAFKRTRKAIVGAKVVHDPKKFDDPKDYHGFSDEFGTKNRAANPTWRHAVIKNKPKARAEFEQALRSLLRKVNKTR